MLKRLLQLCFGAALMLAALFGSVGRWDWWNGWLLFGLYIAAIVSTWLTVMRKHPDLVAERASGWKRAKPWDKVFLVIATIVGPVATWALAGFGARFGWRQAPSPWAEIAGVAITVAGYALVEWAMASNNFFSSVVRIQTDRGHTVASGGPYRYVRHPGYVGMIAFTLAMPLVLGTYVSFIPAILTAAAMVVRTAFEDRTLQRDLDGYAGYAQRVRFRLAPRVW